MTLQPKFKNFKFDDFPQEYQSFKQPVVFAKNILRQKWFTSLRPAEGLMPTLYCIKRLKVEHKWFIQYIKVQG